MKKILFMILVMAVLGMVLCSCEFGPQINNNISGNVIEIDADFPQGRLKDESSIFTDNICLAVAHITSDTEQELIDKYFTSNTAYETLPEITFDFESTEPLDEYMFYPKDENVIMSVAECSIDEEGNLVEGQTIFSDEMAPFKLFFLNYESTTPQYIFKYKVGEFEDSFPIVLSGFDGHLSLTGHESEVLDISVYNDEAAY